MPNRFSAARIVSVWKSTPDASNLAEERVVIESPLEIRLVYGEYGNRQYRRLAVTMRTPGCDFELVTGFLFCEGIIRKREEIILMRYLGLGNDDPAAGDVLQVELHPSLSVDPGHFDRQTATHAACSLCGRESLEMLQLQCPFPIPVEANCLSASVLRQIPEQLEAAQHLFSCTGGAHAAALFGLDGRLVGVWEDIGRHNALDKLVGFALDAGLLPLRRHLCLVSGRVGYELVQKAGMAGIAVLAAVGAPSSLAIEMAEAQQMTLVGFLRQGQFNIYSGQTRIGG